MAAVAKAGYVNPTGVQAQAIPHLLAGQDVLAQSQTGTGKTAAFGLPLIQNIDLSNNTVQALVMAPTRELAAQVAGELTIFSNNSAKIALLVGGQPFAPQVRSLRMGAQIVVGTPGRILDHIGRSTLNLSTARMAVLDEADEMLALGFQEDVEAILGGLPEGKQTALFSATLPPRILSLAEKNMNSPVRLKIGAVRGTVAELTHSGCLVPHGKKREAMTRWLLHEMPESAIVFCATRKESAELAERLRGTGFDAEPLHGEMVQNERDRVMNAFRDGRLQVVVATDVAARGLDVPSVSHVFNYDVPRDAEQYLHRVGRTGRAGRTGAAITLLERKDARLWRNIEFATGKPIALLPVPTVAQISVRRLESWEVKLREQITQLGSEASRAIVGSLSDEFGAQNVAVAALDIAMLSAPQQELTGEDLTVAEVRPKIVSPALIGLNMGRLEGIRPGDVMRMITTEIGLPGRLVGVIELQEHTTTVEIRTDDSEGLCRKLGAARVHGKRIKARVIRESGAQAMRDAEPPRQHVHSGGDHTFAKHHKRHKH
ncbi:MAG: DEAD/DEAH box helicase [Chthonomonadales bacterium]